MVDTLSTPHGHVPHDDAATVQGTPRGSVHGEKGEKKGSDLDITTEPIARPEADQDPESGDKLHRGLKNRHIQMISIGGVIGTGLFLGTATALAEGGPAGLVLGYSVMGSICIAVMVSLGECIAHLPVAGGHITLATRFVDPSLGFAMGYNWTIVLPAELNAAAVLIGYWSDVPSAAWIALTLVVALAINLPGARVYGECEYWFAIIKVLTVIIDCGGAGNDFIGGKYWRDPGPWVNIYGIAGSLGEFLGWWSVLLQAAFSFIGTEIVALAAGETKDPGRNIPKAIKRVYIRIVLFYMLSTATVGLVVPSNDPRLDLGSGTAAASPFVIAVQDAGINILPSIINAALLTSAWSAASSDLYTSSRALYGMALNGSAPRFLLKTTRWGLPIYPYIIGALFSLLSFMSAGSSTAGEVFGYFVNMTSICGMLTWMGILITYLRWYSAITKREDINRNVLNYKAPLQPWLAIYALVMVLCILLFAGWSVFLNGNWDTATFITTYLPTMLFPVLYFGHKFIKRTKMVPAHELDFWTGHADPSYGETKDPTTWYGKLWAAIS